MTRDSDIFIPYCERSNIASQNNGDIFISIHANIDLNGMVLKFYFLSEVSSDSEEENAA